MTDRTHTALVVAIGAAVGGAAAYLLFTEGGRRLRGHVNGLLDDVQKWHGAVERVTALAGAGGHAVAALFQAAGRPDERDVAPGTSLH